MDICERIPPSAKPFTQHSYLSIDEEEPVGFDDHAEHIIEKLVRGTREMDVISIVGMAGQGKTALARKIYNDHHIMCHFDARAWYPVSQIYNVRNLLLEILKQIRGDKSDNVDDPGDVLRKHLMGRRYLVVLDDIWEPEAWDDLRQFFPCQVNGSRIIVTTRNEELAMYIKHHSDPYSLPFLRHEDSWELLQKKVFQGESCPSELLNVGPLVAKNCKGLPYLIIMIAEILSKKKREPSLWLEIAYDISSHALAEESMKVIQLSYDCLEDHLKSCLLYMGLFPEGYEIPVSDLLKWWIAEEFVQNIDMLELEETSKSFLDDLVNKNLVLFSKRRASGEMKCCIVLDQVREFCLRKITEEKFMQLIVPYNPHQTLDLNEQRLCMYIHDTLRSDSRERESFGNSQGSLEFIVHPKFRISDPKNPFGLLNNLRCIRVLYLLNIYLGSSWATAFKSLTQLRYLALFVKVFDVKWVSHLLHLQTLRVRSSYIMMSPAIWKMKKLRHVDISEFSITWEEDDERVINLRTLGLCYVSVTDMTPKFWGKFPNLEELKLHIDVFGDITNYSVSDQLMSLEMFPRRLKVLSLNDIFLTDEIVSSIAKMVHLETLKLSEIYFTGEKIWVLNDNQFYGLKVLKLHHVFMTRWICSDESFPMLEKLFIKSCTKLEEIPFCFADIPTLELIKVIDCSDSVEISALNIGKEVEELGWKIQVHIWKKD